LQGEKGRGGSSQLIVEMQGERKRKNFVKRIGGERKIPLNGKKKKKKTEAHHLQERKRGPSLEKGKERSNCHSAPEEKEKVSKSERKKKLSSTVRENKKKGERGSSLLSTFLIQKKGKYTPTNLKREGKGKKFLLFQ